MESTLTHAYKCPHNQATTQYIRTHTHLIWPLSLFVRLQFMVSMFDTEENVHFMQILLHIITSIMDSIWMVHILDVLYLFIFFCCLCVHECVFLWPVGKLIKWIRWYMRAHDTRDNWIARLVCGSHMRWRQVRWWRSGMHFVFFFFFANWHWSQL